MIEIINPSTVVSKEEVVRGKQKHVEVIPKESSVIVTEKTNKIGEISYDITINDILAPVKVGDSIGKMIIKSDNEIIDEVELTVKEDVEKANILELYGRYLNDIISGGIQF